MRHIVIIGATSAIAERCARQWAMQAPTRFGLIGRDGGKLERIAADLKVRSPASEAQVHVVDLLDAAAIAQCVTRITDIAPVDIALIAHGWLPEQAQCEQDLTLAAQALQVNAVSPVLWAEAFVNAMAATGKGTVLVIGSVAGDRGRRSNYVYGAAKGLVERYVQGLQHRCASSAVRVGLIKPGPTDTPMTAHLRGQGMRLADPERVAADILRTAASGQRVRYTPWPWRFIMAIIRAIPAPIFHRLNL